MNAKTFRLDESLGYLTHRAARALANDLGRRFAVAGLDLTAEQWRVMTLLWDRDGRTQQEISGGLLQEKTGISRLVDGLEARSLAVRARDERDSRKRRVYLTIEGKKLRRGCIAAASATLEQAVAGVPEEKLEACLEVLRRVARNLTPAEGTPKD
ncbi:MAG: MarR family winged helix-turn-helix transcriptional regulator [Desulfovibrionaceae bacterium]|uniref:MarR family winged helix-turn-helix transcriptional regulator n=1 Tax=Desulfovibrio aminophilus TaxID=81425 RepID=UPI000410F640|nr:MarR family winged helix-turn-helix transcriptional regulator [Desulfovibrio aminophilus]MDY0306533.1 MarR family winged helix-turn-helix transcriptional regulator [Desulfovibrionaceae bacterium]